MEPVLQYKIGDVVCHRADKKLLGTICGVKGEKVIVRRVETLLEIEIYPQELISKDIVDAEESAKWGAASENNQKDWEI